MKPTLVILAAGMASRYGSMKQVEGFGPDGETIMDYSIYDAIRAGFGKVVFIIREEFAQNFKNIFEPKLHGKIETAYVFQALDSYTNGRTIPAERKKPWGTAHAVLCCKEEVKEPFAVINADDFYGKDAFVKACQFLSNSVNESTYSIIGYQLKNTLSKNGSVSRGVCEVDANGNIKSIQERIKIFRNEDGSVVYEDELGVHEVSENASISMNFWCFYPNVFELTQTLFNQFLDTQITQPKSEFFIPLVADEFIKSNKGVIKVIPTTAQWFGVTYKEDAPTVKQSLQHLLNVGEYPKILWK
jgi:NDP-sugar pyrophosphorylase family protein